jgi:hypothetical protein
MVIYAGCLERHTVIQTIFAGRAPVGVDMDNIRGFMAVCELIKTEFDMHFVGQGVKLAPVAEHDKLGEF